MKNCWGIRKGNSAGCFGGGGGNWVSTNNSTIYTIGIFERGRGRAVGLAGFRWFGLLWFQVPWGWAGWLMGRLVG